MSETEDHHLHIVRMMEEVSFRIEFMPVTGRALITGAVGWIADEVVVAEGTYEEIHAEAHRLVDLAVTKKRCSKYANRPAGGEKKRDITIATKYARSALHGAKYRVPQGEKRVASPRVQGDPSAG